MLLLRTLIHTLCFCGITLYYLTCVNDKSYNIFIKKKKICTYMADYGHISVLIMATFSLETKFKVNSLKLVKLSREQ